MYMQDNKQLAKDLSIKIEYTPMDDRILVKPMKPVMVTKEFPVLDKEPSNLDEAEQTEPKFEKRKVEANIQKGIVIKLGTEYADEDVPKRLRNLEVGDTVFYPRTAGMPFELLKDAKLLRRYELVGKA